MKTSEIRRSIKKDYHRIIIEVICVDANPNFLHSGSSVLNIYVTLSTYIFKLMSKIEIYIWHAHNFKYIPKNKYYVLVYINIYAHIYQMYVINFVE